MAARPPQPPPASRAHDNLLEQQRRIFRTLQTEAEQLLGTMPEAIRRYERVFEKDFQGIKALDLRTASVSKRELLRAVRESDVTFVADFHAFPQAQRAALRILRDAVRRGETWFLGLEFVSSKNQAELDAFQEGRLPLDDFLSAINYRTDWGFPWSNYAPILRWARENGVRAIALNRPRELRTLLDAKAFSLEDRTAWSARELHRRDRWAAGVITDLFAQLGERRRPSSGARKPRMIVLYGELHVATSHLPLELRKVSHKFLGRPLKPLSVHQSHDELYWHLASLHREHDTHVVKLREDAYCVLTATPWAKLQSLVSWAEAGPLAPEDAPPASLSISDYDDDGDLLVDHLSQTRSYGEAIAELMGLAPAPFSDLSIHTIEEADFLESLPRDALSAAERSLVRFHILQNQRIFLPRSGVAYAGSASPNSLAEVAALHLFRHVTRAKTIDFLTTDDFFLHVLEAAFAFFGSLLINPRRKCDLPGDLRARVDSLQENHRPAYPGEREAKILAIALLERQRTVLKGEGAAPVFFFKYLGNTRLAPAAAMAARYVGRILGKRMHDAWIHDALSAKDIRSYLRPRPVPTFQERYVQLLRALARVKTSHKIPRTKSESL